MVNETICMKTLYKMVKNLPINNAIEENVIIKPIIHISIFKHNNYLITDLLWAGRYYIKRNTNLDF